MRLPSYQGGRLISGVGPGVVVGGNERQLLVDHNLLGQLEHVVQREGGADQVLAITGASGEKLLLLILHGGLEVKVLLLALENGPANAAAIDLLQVQSLGKVVIKFSLGKNIETRREVLVPLGAGMVDGGFGLG